MSEIRESSYYEIALTNRQVMTMFVILLGCLVAAFLSGVWIGRRGESVPVDTVAAQTITSGVAPGEAPLEELRFFSEEGGEGVADAPRETAAQAPPRVEPAPQVRREPAAAGEAPAGAAARAPSRAPAGREAAAQAAAPDPPDPAATSPAGRPEATAPAEQSAPSPAPAAPAESTPATPAAAAPATPAAPAPAAAEEPTTPRSLVVIQVFSSNDRAQAERVVERLRGGGLPALLAPVEVSGRTMYRVRIGPYRDPDQAESVADRVRKEFRLDTWIID